MPERRRRTTRNDSDTDLHRSASSPISTSRGLIDHRKNDRPRSHRHREKISLPDEKIRNAPKVEYGSRTSPRLGRPCRKKSRDRSDRRKRTHDRLEGRCVRQPGHPEEPSMAKCAKHTKRKERGLSGRLERHIAESESQSASMDSGLKKKRKKGGSESTNRCFLREALGISKQHAADHSEGAYTVSTPSVVLRSRRGDLTEKHDKRSQQQGLPRTKSRSYIEEKHALRKKHTTREHLSTSSSSVSSSESARPRRNQLEPLQSATFSPGMVGQWMIHQQMMRQHMMTCAYYTQQQQMIHLPMAGNNANSMALTDARVDVSVKPKTKTRKTRWGPEELSVSGARTLLPLTPSVESVKQDIAARLELKKKTGISSLALSAIATAQARKSKSAGSVKSFVSEPMPDKLSGDFWEVSRSEIGLKLLGELCASGDQWNYVLLDESRRSFAGFLPNAIHADICSEYFEKIRNAVDWQQPQTPSGPIPRKTSWMVSHGCTCTYRYGGIGVLPVLYPLWMKELMHEVLPKCGLGQVDQWPNCCNLNLYEDGASSVGWHADDEALFQGRFHDCRIISLSLGAARKFELRLNWPEIGDRPVVSMVLGDGVLCTMEGMTQKHFQHRVPREAGVVGARINLTWRWVVKHTPSCVVGRCRLES